ncbi:site-specific integrase [Tolumonas lignilytica]|uniref:site-specific integrase n=1 Tax=Tolumonas lignilytica TaxID=1283284 RepID=UPI000465A668|nr:site-specific integrase [Tolumonas lignilytica]
MSTESYSSVINESILSHEQVVFIEELKLPKHVIIQTDSRFDSVISDTAEDKWRFIIGAEKEVFNFTDIFDLSMKKLIKFCIVSLINSGRALRGTNFNLIKHAFSFNDFSYKGFKDALCSTELLGKPEMYFAVKGVLRVLCRLNFPRFSVENLDDFLLIPTPNSDNPFIKYQDLENALPSSLKCLIARSIVSASKNRMILSSNEITDFTLFGLSYYTGMRSIQFAKITAGDFKQDTSNDKSGLYRYCLNMPYAKQTKITNNKVKVALPAELGLLVDEYIKRGKLKPEDRFIPVDENLVNFLNNILQRVLLIIQPKEVQEKVAKDEIILPKLTTYDFRHNVGHSLALAGASADEIAYMLGHSSLIAATYYISATPELAMLKSKALGDNPVWKNMVNLLLTGYSVENTAWSKRTVSGSLGGELHIKIGGCERPDEQCHLAKVRSCYGCFYFRPFTDLNKHYSVLRAVNKELIDTLEVSEMSGNVRNPAIEILANLKGEVQMVINRIEGGFK